MVQDTYCGGQLLAKRAQHDACCRGDMPVNYKTMVMFCCLVVSSSSAWFSSELSQAFTSSSSGEVFTREVHGFVLTKYGVQCVSFEMHEGLLTLNSQTGQN